MATSTPSAASLVDHEDPDRRARTQPGTPTMLPSMEIERCNAAITEAANLRLKGGFTMSGYDYHAGDGREKVFQKMRRLIAALTLSPSRLCRLVELAWGAACRTECPWGGKLEDDGARKDGFTHGQWRNAAWVVASAAHSLLLTYRPARDEDVLTLLRLCRLNSMRFPSREAERFKRRMMRYLENMVDGAPFDWGAYPKAGEVRAAKKASPRKKAPRSVAVVAFAGKSRGARRATQ